MMMAKTYRHRRDKEPINTYVFFDPEKYNKQSLEGEIVRRHEDGTYDVEFKTLTPKKQLTKQEELEKKEIEKMMKKEKAKEDYKKEEAGSGEGPPKEDEDTKQATGREAEEGEQTVTACSIGRDLLFSTLSDELLELETTKLESKIELPRNDEIEEEKAKFEGQNSIVIGIKAKKNKVIVRNLYIALTDKLPANEECFSLDVYAYPGTLREIENQCQAEDKDLPFGDSAHQKAHMRTSFSGYAH